MHISECYNFCYCEKLLKVLSYPKCYFNSLNILWINNTVCGDSGTGMAEIIFRVASQMAAFRGNSLSGDFFFLKEKYLDKKLLHNYVLARNYCGRNSVWSSHSFLIRCN